MAAAPEAADTVLSVLSVTVSVGVAALEPGDAEVEDLLARADASIYRAKEGGRDRVGD